MNLISWLSEHAPWITFVGAMTAAIGVFLQAGKQAELNRQIAALTRENATLSKEIAESSKTTLATVTGADSICYVRMTFGGTDPNKAILVLIHEGSYPLHDVQIRIWDPNNYETNAPSTTLQDFLAKSSILPTITTLAPGRVISLQEWVLPSSEQQDYAVTIMARHQDFTEEIKLRRVNGKWEEGLRLHRGMDRGSHPVKEILSEKFPRG